MTMPLMWAVFGCLARTVAFGRLGILPEISPAEFSFRLIWAYLTGLLASPFLLPLAAVYIVGVNMFLFRRHHHKRPAIFVGLVAFSDLCFILSLAQWLGWSDICLIRTGYMLVPWADGGAPFLISVPLASAMTFSGWLRATNAPHATRRAFGVYAACLIILATVFTLRFIRADWGEGGWMSSLSSTKGSAWCSLNRGGKGQLRLRLPEDIPGQSEPFDLPVRWATTGKSLVLWTQNEFTIKHGKYAHTILKPGTVLVRGTLEPDLRMELEVTLPKTPAIKYTVAHYFSPH